MGQGIEREAMSETAKRKRQFRCQHCNELIVIPWDLPPTKGPCPHCGKEILSPPVPQAEGEPKVADKLPIPNAPAMPDAGRESRTETNHRRAVAASVPMPAPKSDDLGPGRARKPGGVKAAPIPQVPTVPAGGQRDDAPPPRYRGGAMDRVLDKPILEKEREPRPRRGRLAAGLVALLLLALIAAAAVWLVRKYSQPEAETPGKADSQQVEPKEKPGGKTDAGTQTGAENGAEKAAETDEAPRVPHHSKKEWRAKVSKALEKFIAARTVEEKALCSIGGAALLPEMAEYYGTEEIDDSDTPASAFSYYDLRDEDRERGLFLMIYDLPPGFELNEFFRPLPTMEERYGIGSPDMPLSAFVRSGDFDIDPVRVQAFFKETPDGLKIDWHVFVQTKDRLLGSFLFRPVPGRREVFRVLLSEDAANGGRGGAGMRTYRIDDPIHPADWMRVEVPVDSEIGRILAKANWQGGPDGARPAPKTATVELAWSDGDDPQIGISRFICWEFLGLGGTSKPKDNSGTAE
jgi:hypothetical protein